TSATNFPTSGGPFTTNAGGQDGFVSRLGPTATTLSYSTYLGGSGTDSVNGVGLDPLGNAYAVGDTNSTNFPAANPSPGGLPGPPTSHPSLSKIGLKPSPPRITDVSTDTGASPHDQITNDQTLDLLGTAAAGATVTVYRRDLGLLGTTTASGA